MSRIGREPSPGALIAILSATSVLGMLGISSFAALLPEFQRLWSLDNTEAGWISSLYLAGYVVAVPVLVGSTDHTDPRKVYLFSLVIGGLASVAYALFAQGFWSAALFRFIAGLGLAGTYMPGLKLLTDRVHGPRQNRYVAYYTSGFSLGTAVSYGFTGEMADRFGWGAAFWGVAVGSAAAFAMIYFLVPPGGHGAVFVEGRGRRFDFRPVFKNRAAMAFILGYAGHIFELFALRAWMVAYLIYADRLRGGSDDGTLVNWVATAAALIGTFASIYGAEVAVRADRRRMIGRVMVFSFLVSVVTGFSAGLPIWIVVALCCAYNMLVMGDSAALTNGAVISSPSGQRGVTLAVHSLIGFAGGMAGPLAVGVVLDAAGGGASHLAWGLGFVTMGLGSLTALIAIRKL